jgi:hypothetical protein
MDQYADARRLVLVGGQLQIFQRDSW